MVFLLPILVTIFFAGVAVAGSSDAKESKASYQSRFVTYDSVTGEVIEGTPVYVAGKAKWNVRGWFVGFQSSFSALSEDREMTGEVCRVWMKLLGELGFENFIVVRQVDLAASLKMQKTHISRAIKTLVRKGLLIEGPKIGRSTAYRLSLDVAWKGSRESYKENVEISRSSAAKTLAKERWKVFQEVHQNHSKDK